MKADFESGQENVTELFQMPDIVNFQQDSERDSWKFFFDVTLKDLCRPPDEVKILSICTFLAL